MQDIIEAKITEALSPAHLIVENESHMHSGPATESHFKITAVAPAFDNMPLVKRHQQVYALLKTELATGIHALALHLYSPREWEMRQQSIPESPHCRGGSKSS